MTAAVLLTAYGVFAQNFQFLGEQCTECFVYVEGRHLRPSDHKPGCSQSSSSSTSGESGSSWGSSPYSDSGFFDNIEGKPLTNDEYYELLLRTHCDYCGGDFTRHTGSCLIGSVFNDWQRTMKAGNEKDAIRLRDNVVTLFLATDSGKEKLHQMRGTTAPKPVAEKPSTHLKDYTPAPERPAPRFSGINEQSIVYEKMQSSTGTHEWGVLQDSYDKSPFEYDIERRTHTDGGPVILGKRNPDGSIRWRVLHRDMNGKYVGPELLKSAHTKFGELRLLDVRLEGEGQFVVEEFEGGFKKYYTAHDDIITSGYHVGLAPMMINGRFFLLQEPDSSEDKKALYAGPSNMLIGDDLILLDDAIIVKNDYGDRLCNWNWTCLNIEGTSFFKSVTCFKSSRGPYYVIEVTDGAFALIARGFRRVGGTYSSAQEAHAAWNGL